MNSFGGVRTVVRLDIGAREAGGRALVVARKESGLLFISGWACGQNTCKATMVSLLLVHGGGAREGRVATWLRWPEMPEY